MMTIAIIGYGKMGKEVERICGERKTISVKEIFTEVNNFRRIGLSATALKDIDVCIDFSTPTSVMRHIEAAIECGKNIVVGTTGWYDALPKVKKMVEKGKIGFLYSPNFSLGMNIFFQMLTSAGHYFDKYDMYDVAIQEIHHHGKSDSPSGTALALGEILIQHIRSKKEMLVDAAHKKIEPSQLHITSTRLGHVAGTHRIMFDSAADTIELVHTAKDRSGFALGALVAAEWLKGKKGMFTMKDVLSSS